MGDVKTPESTDFAGELQGFAAYVRSCGRGNGIAPDDCEFVARKFEAAAKELKRLVTDARVRPPPNVTQTTYDTPRLSTATSRAEPQKTLRHPVGPQMREDDP